MLASRGLHSVTAVEPNENMLEQGLAARPATKSYGVGAQLKRQGCLLNPMTWLRWPHPFIGLISKSPAENFSDILRPSGRFAAVWNSAFSRAQSIPA